MRRPGRKWVEVYRKGPRNRDGDATLGLVGAYGGVSVQMSGTSEDTLDGRAERAVTNWTLIFPAGTDIRPSDVLVIQNYNAAGDLRLTVDGRPHEPQFRSGRPSNTIVRAVEVETS